MDIKGLAKSILPFDFQNRVEAKQDPKLKESTEREGNGQMPQGGGEEPPRRNLTPEELQEAVRFLEGLSGVKDNNLVVRLEHKDGINVIYVTEQNGKVVRRIPESDISLLMKNAASKKTGQILDKAM